MHLEKHFYAKKKKNDRKCNRKETSNKAIARWCPLLGASSYFQAFENVTAYCCWIQDLHPKFGKTLLMWMLWSLSHLSCYLSLGKCYQFLKQFFLLVIQTIYIHHRKIGSNIKSVKEKIKSEILLIMLLCIFCFARFILCIWMFTRVFTKNKVKPRKILKFFLLNWKLHVTTFLYQIYIYLN